MLSVFLIFLLSCRIWFFSVIYIYIHEFVLPKIRRVSKVCHRSTTTMVGGGSVRVSAYFQSWILAAFISDIHRYFSMSLKIVFLFVGKSRSSIQAPFFFFRRQLTYDWNGFLVPYLPLGLLSLVGYFKLWSGEGFEFRS